VTTTEPTARTAAAILARKQHAAGLLRDVQDALRQMRRDGTRMSFRAVAHRAGVSRTFLYENPEARKLVDDAVAASDERRKIEREIGHQTTHQEAS
jgi:hypothetical protein